MPADADRLLTLQQLADRFQVTPATIYAMNSAGTAPPRIRVANRVRYRESDVLQWEAEHEVKAVP
jgi:predicted DNA-binding transcriptional regulator AlpA